MADPLREIIDRATVNVPQTPSTAPFVCPVCQGRRTVPPGFYGFYWGSGATNAEPEPCRSCDGTGVVWR